jgi:hypothetical protein
MRILNIGGYGEIGRGLYDTVIFNKEHLYSKNFTRARKIYITSLINQGVFYPLTKPSPTPLKHGGHPRGLHGGLRGSLIGGLTTPHPNPFES